MSWEVRREVEASNRDGGTETAPPDTRKLLICARQRENHVPKGNMDSQDFYQWG